MAYQKRKSLIRQLQECLDNKLQIGESKHVAKIHGTSTNYIYSWNTYHAYLKHGSYFVKWCKANYNCKDLVDCRQYADEWLATRQELSAYTQKLEVSALCKIYGCSSSDFIKTKSRLRKDIKRSRNKTDMDKHFSEANHKDLVMFCRACGLRRNELKYIKGSDLTYINNIPYIHVHIGSKGGKERYAPIADNVTMITGLMKAKGDNRLFDSIPSKADIHSYRSEYATLLYKSIARPLDQVPKAEQYYCRAELKGVVYDKKAMLYVSHALGHNRISVIAGHYLR